MKFLILSPVYSSLADETASAIYELVHQHDCGRLRLCGCSQLDIARTELAHEALEQTATDWFLWVDADIVFRPQQALDLWQLASELELELVGADYPTKRKGGARRTAVLAPGGQPHPRSPALMPALRMGFGFVLLHRIAFRALEKKTPLAYVNSMQRPMRPYFAPIQMVTAGKPHLTYYSEDYAFCERARMAGVPLWCDTSIKLGHIGPYIYDEQDLQTGD